MGNYILSNKRHVLTFIVSVVLSVLLVAFYAVGASLVDTDSVGVGTTTVGAGLSVAEGMPTVLSSNAYIYGKLMLPFLVSTSTTASSFGGPVGVGTTTPGATRFGVNEGWTSILSGPAYVYGQLMFPYLVSTSTTASSFGGPVGVGTTTPGATRFGVNEGWTSILSGPAYVYGQLTVPYIVATSTVTTATSTLSNINIDSNTFIVDRSNRVAIATTTFGSINDETMTIQVGSATASTTMYLGGSGSMLIMRTSDGGDCVAISFKQAATAVGANAVLQSEFITCPAE